jgi:hypothetical protein
MTSTSTLTTVTSLISNIASSPTKKPGSQSTGSNNISPGAAAGIGIGSAIAGALLALLAFYVFMKRSNRSRHGKHRQSREIDLEKPLDRTETTREESLIQRADDSQIRKSMQELNELIDQHVENYYDLKSFDGDQRDLALRLAECGFGTELPSTAAELASILKNSKSRFVGIRHLIAAILVNNVCFRASVECSLLSPKIAAFCLNMPPVERQPGCNEGMSFRCFEN